MLENVITNAQENLELNINIIKTVIIALCTYYTNYKIINKKISVNLRLIVDIFSITIGTTLCVVIRYEVSYLMSIVCLMLLISIIFSHENIAKSILTTTLSLSINYAILLIAIIINFIFNATVRLNDNVINMYIIMACYIILLFLILKTKKFKYGISFLNNNVENEVTDILILNIGVIILFSIIIIVINTNIKLVKNLIIGTVIFSFIMFVIVKKSLQLYYKQKLLIQDLNETKEELAKKTKEVEEMEAEILSFSKKSHTLVHKQKSLEYKLQEIMNKTEISTEESAEVRDRLKEIGKDLYKEKTSIELDKTEISEIDDMLKYMQSECKKNNIDFELQLKGNIHYMTNNLIAKEDLETLLADHIKNAIIAINHTNNVNRSILVRLGQIDENYGLYIYDSGIEFEAETLKNLGKKPSTTHAEEGGTGMGFMNTFDTLRKYKASLIIEEYNKPSRDNYTKALMIKFDNKNEFKIKSYRENTL